MFSMSNQVNCCRQKKKPQKIASAFTRGILLSFLSDQELTEAKPFQMKSSGRVPSMMLTDSQNRKRLQVETVFSTCVLLRGLCPCEKKKQLSKSSLIITTVLPGIIPHQCMWRRDCLHRKCMHNTSPTPVNHRHGYHLPQMPPHPLARTWRLSVTFDDPLWPPQISEPTCHPFPISESLLVPVAGHDRWDTSVVQLKWDLNQ